MLHELRLQGWCRLTAYCLSFMLGYAWLVVSVAYVGLLVLKLFIISRPSRLSLEAFSGHSRLTGDNQNVVF